MKIKALIASTLLFSTTAGADVVNCSSEEFFASPLCNPNFSVPEPSPEPAPSIVIRTLTPIEPPSTIPLAEEVTLCGGVPCVDTAPPVGTPAPAPTVVATPEIKDLFGGTLPNLYPFSNKQLQEWHDDAATEGPTNAYNHYLACWHTRAVEQSICGLR